jgi:ectoine hydroxylase-related dioxygenase (phytanoyl-CoA dioxygenase family)
MLHPDRRPTEEIEMIDIGPTEIERYHADGYLPLGSVVDGAEREALLAAERRFRAASPFGTSAGLVVTEQVEHMSAAVRRFCCDGRHVDAVEVLLGPDFALTHNQFIVKLPGTSSGTSDIPLHQDNGYGRLEPPDDITVWVALTDTTTENGCLVVAPRSHLCGLLEHRVATTNPALREASAVETVPLELAAGEAVAFSGMMLHGSGGNRTEVERVALFARYCVPHARMMIEGGKAVLEDGHSWMVRGEASLETWRRGNEAFTG